MPALQGTSPQVQPVQLQRMLGVSSEDTIDMLLADCPEVAELQPSVLMSRLCMLKVACSDKGLTLHEGPYHSHVA